MIITNKEPPVTIQIRKPGQKSECLTVHDQEVQDVYNKIYFLFKNLEDSGDATITFYNTKRRTKCQNEN